MAGTWRRLVEDNEAQEAYNLIGWVQFFRGCNLLTRSPVCSAMRERIAHRKRATVNTEWATASPLHSVFS